MYIALKEKRKNFKKDPAARDVFQSNNDKLSILADDFMAPEEKVAKYNENFRKFKNLFNKRRERAKNIAIRDILLNEPIEFVNENPTIIKAEVKDDEEFIPLQETPKRKELSAEFAEKKIARILDYIQDHHKQLGVSADGKIERRRGVVFKKSNIENVVRTMLGYSKPARKPDGYNMACQKFLEDVTLIRMIGMAKLVTQE